MKAVIIAAGMGQRMGELTRSMPKCLLKVNGVTLLENLVNRFNSFGITEIAVVTGYCADMIDIPGITVFRNDNYEHNNILHSLMYAQEYFDDDMVVSYSDIWLEDDPIVHLINHPGDIVLSVDSEWLNSYEGRTEHPVSEAENVFYNRDQIVTQVGKHLDQDLCANDEICGEFIGLFKLNKSFSRRFVDIFLELDKELSVKKPFQQSKSWHSAYLTDFFLELISRNHEVCCSLHQGGWAEIDTVQDFERTNIKFERKNAAHRKKLGSLILSEANDLKRTIPAMANELGMETKELQAVINGDVSIHAINQVICAMGDNYPIDPSTLMLPRDDCENGVRVMRFQQSEVSSRVFDRMDTSGSYSPYYEYRDTAMSSLAPFRPEWIKELRAVTDSDPENPSVVYNNGHFMHQITFFIGPVNFYWEVKGKKYCCEMNTGDSNYITPYWPHSFASRDPSQEAIIIAVTFGGEVRRSQKELYALGRRAGKYVFDSRNTKKGYKQVLEDLVANEMMNANILDKKSSAGTLNPIISDVLKGKRELTFDEISQLADLLDLEPAELLIPAYDPEHEVMVKKRDAEAAYIFPDNNNPYYKIIPAVRIPKMSGLKGFEIEVLPGAHDAYDLSTCLHSYIYNFGDTEIIFNWDDSTSCRKTILYPGDSAYLQPFITHSFRTLETPGRLFVVRIPGAINFTTRKELSAFADADRAFSETMCWFD